MSQLSLENQQVENKIKFSKGKKITPDITLLLSSPKWFSDQKGLRFLILIVPPHCHLPPAPGPANSFSPFRACLDASHPCFSSPHSYPLLELSYQSFFLSLGPFHFLTFQSSFLSSGDSLFPLHPFLSSSPFFSLPPILYPSLFSSSPLLQTPDLWQILY